MERNHMKLIRSDFNESMLLLAAKVIANFFAMKRTAATEKA